MYTRIIYGLFNGAFNYSEFLCDNISDLNDLPTNIKKGFSNNKKVETCSFGSKAKVLENKQDYILNANNEWKPYINYNMSPFQNSLLEVTDDNIGNVTINRKVN